MTHTISVTPRDVTSKKIALPDGHVPAVIYGPQQPATHVSVVESDVIKLRQTAGDASVLEVEGLSETVEVLFKDVTTNPLTRTITHVDLYAIERGKDMTATVPLHLEGDAPVEKSGTGSVTQILQDISVTCRPSKLPENIMVDLSVLDTADSKITVADLPQIEGVSYDLDPEDAVVTVSAARTDVDESADPESVDVSAVASEEAGSADSAE